MSLDDDATTSPHSTVAGALLAAQAAGIERLDAQWLMADLLAQSRAWLVAHADNPLDPAQWRSWLDLLRRLGDGEPLAYLMGKQAFFGLTLQVDPAVLVPRADTETLVEWAIDTLRLRGPAAPGTAIDLGCGSGAIALALKTACPAVQLTATDLSSQALGVAAANGARLGLTIDWRSGHWWAAAGNTRFDLAVSNPPYIAADDPHLAELRHEPWQALVAGDCGLEALRQIIADAPDHLRPGAWLLLEHGFQQAEAVSTLLRTRGFDCVQTRLDLAGRPRCSGGRWPGR